MKIINASIDLNKIDKSKIQTTDKNGNPFKNGAKYYNITITVKDTVDEFKNDVSITTQQTKEQREAKEKAVFIGNGKVVFSKEAEASQPKDEFPESNIVDTGEDPFA